MDNGSGVSSLSYVLVPPGPALASSRSSATSSYGEVLPSRLLEGGPVESFAGSPLALSANLDEPILGGPFTSSPLALASNLGPRTASRASVHSESVVSASSRGGNKALDAIRDQVGDQIALRAISRAETVDGSKVGVVTTISGSTDPLILRSIAESIEYHFTLRATPYLLALSLPGQPEDDIPLLLVASAPEFLQRASLLVHAKFGERVGAGSRHAPSQRRWFARVRGLGASPFDEDALWDVLRKAARHLIDPLTPPPGSVGIAARLETERARLERVSARRAYDELREPSSPWPVVLVDIRPAAQRAAEGGIAGALVVERNVLEWRFDPRSDARVPVADRYDLRVIVFCSEGYTSSLAAASLRDLGLLNATDMIGGYKAWKAAGLPAEVEVLATGLPAEEYSFA